MGVDISNYKERKAKKLISLSRLGNNPVMVQKRFSVVDGKPVNDEIVALQMEQLLEQKGALQIQMDNIDDLIADIDLLPIPEPTTTPAPTTTPGPVRGPAELPE